VFHVLAGSGSAEGNPLPLPGLHGLLGVGGAAALCRVHPYRPQSRATRHDQPHGGPLQVCQRASGSAALYLYVMVGRRARVCVYKQSCRGCGPHVYKHSCRGTWLTTSLIFFYCLLELSDSILYFVVK